MTNSPRLPRRAFLGRALAGSASAWSVLRLAAACRAAEPSVASAAGPLPLEMPGYSEPRFPYRTFSIKDFGAQAEASAKNTPDSCRNVLIEDCVLDTGDDCICLKAGRNEDAWAVGRPLENVLIRRCRTKRGHAGVGIGSEMSAGIRNVLVQDCRFDGTDRGLHIKSCPGRGGFVENVRIENLDMDHIVGPAIRVTLRYAKEKGASPALPKFRDFQFRNIVCRKAKQAAELFGLEESPLERMLLERVDITADAGLQAENIRDAELRDVRIAARRSPLMRIANSQAVTIERAARLLSGKRPSNRRRGPGMAQGGADWPDDP